MAEVGVGIGRIICAMSDVSSGVMGDCSGLCVEDSGDGTGGDI